MMKRIKTFIVLKIQNITKDVIFLKVQFFLVLGESV